MLFALGLILHAHPSLGPNAQKLILNKSIDTLPPDLRLLRQQSRPILHHVTDPLTPKPKSRPKSTTTSSISTATAASHTRRSHASTKPGQQIRKIKTRTNRPAAVANRRIQRKTHKPHSGKPTGTKQTQRRNSRQLRRRNPRSIQHHRKFRRPSHAAKRHQRSLRRDTDRSLLLVLSHSPQRCLLHRRPDRPCV